MPRDVWPTVTVSFDSFFPWIACNRYLVFSLDENSLCSENPKILGDVNFLLFEIGGKCQKESGWALDAGFSVGTKL